MTQQSKTLPAPVAMIASEGRQDAAHARGAGAKADQVLRDGEAARPARPERIVLAANGEVPEWPLNCAW